MSEKDRFSLFQFVRIRMSELEKLRFACKSFWPSSWMMEKFIYYPCSQSFQKHEIECFIYKWLETLM